MAGLGDWRRHGPAPLHGLLMDGLAEDADVIFVLTTNRLELLEPALAMRPGRIDQAVEVKLPDNACRRRLFGLHLRDLPGLGDIDLAPLVAATDGVSAAFVKELVRRAVLLAAADAGDVGGPARRRRPPLRGAGGARRVPVTGAADAAGCGHPGGHRAVAGQPVPAPSAPADASSDRISAAFPAGS